MLMVLWPLAALPMCLRLAVVHVCWLCRMVQQQQGQRQALPRVLW